MKLRLTSPDIFRISRRIQEIKLDFPDPTLPQTPFESSLKPSQDFELSVNDK
ncbi:hypothetical protein HanXRQr2_Chr05g0217351 [Helianthus annuus]|uniref:Uncharacterized protein n=1 Tax=Helianthus annuus TaxID=4232 RepID=A0A9K3J0A8_HELAN|nr:hypothetical protein HanXRQr2_Chr05g0217351 [Helianthus annuus]